MNELRTYHYDDDPHEQGPESDTALAYRVALALGWQDSVTLARPMQSAPEWILPYGQGATVPRIAAADFRPCSRLDDAMVFVACLTFNQTKVGMTLSLDELGAAHAWVSAPNVVCYSGHYTRSLPRAVVEAVAAALDGAGYLFVDQECAS